MLSTDEKQPFAPNAEKPAPAWTARGAGRTEFRLPVRLGYAVRPEIKLETYLLAGPVTASAGTPRAHTALVGSAARRTRWTLPRA